MPSGTTQDKAKETVDKAQDTVKGNVDTAKKVELTIVRNHYHDWYEMA